MSEYNEILNKLKNDTNASKESPKQSQGTNGIVQLREISRPNTYIVRLFRNLKDATALPYVEFLRHWWVNPASNDTPKKKAVYKCCGKNCPMCKVYYDHIKIQASDAWQYSQQKVWLMYGLDSTKKITLFSLDFYAKEALKNFMIKQYHNKIDVLDINNGCWLEFQIHLTQNKKKLYNINIINSESVPLTIKEKLVKLPKLENFYTPFNAEQLQKIVKGIKLTDQDFPYKKGNSASSESKELNANKPNISQHQNELVEKILEGTLPETLDAAKEQEFLNKDKENQSDKISNDPDIIDKVEIDDILIDLEKDLKQIPKIETKKSRFSSLYEDDPDSENDK